MPAVVAHVFGRHSQHLDTSSNSSTPLNTAHMASVSRSPCACRRFLRVGPVLAPFEHLDHRRRFFRGSRYSIEKRKKRQKQASVNTSGRWRRAYRHREIGEVVERHRASSSHHSSESRATRRKLHLRAESFAGRAVPSAARGRQRRRMRSYLGATVITFESELSTT